MSGSSPLRSFARGGGGVDPSADLAAVTGHPAIRGSAKLPRHRPLQDGQQPLQRGRPACEDGDHGVISAGELPGGFQEKNLLLCPFRVNLRPVRHRSGVVHVDELQRWPTAALKQALAAAAEFTPRIVKEHMLGWRLLEW